ncbi:protostome-specific GEF [Haematobia irritans]|uniref:protostome-specific GEF n=1 Tax=Haematobia irritans TaxID=7368 RepID=UPI003F4FD6F7
MAAMTQMRNTDDAVSIDSMAAPVASSGGLMDHHQQPPMILSKKALHQRDADENLFLRFLELDPPASDAVPTTPGGRRNSNSKPIGRTPFTMTKKLTRTAERGFGFSIVWTHPPRVEKVEPGLSADRCGILPGDYVIFVDKHNVVTMPEADVLNLIRSQGATLTLEIFRRSGSGTGAAATGSSHTTTTATTATHRSLATTVPMNGKSSRMAASGTSINNVTGDESAVTSLVLKQVAPPVHRPPTACSGGTMSSMEAAKRRLNLPQVTFSKEVGKGVIVHIKSEAAMATMRLKIVEEWTEIRNMTNDRRIFWKTVGVMVDVATIHDRITEMTIAVECHIVMVVLRMMTIVLEEWDPRTRYQIPLPVTSSIVDPSVYMFGVPKGNRPVFPFLYTWYNRVCMQAVLSSVFKLLSLRSVSSAVFLTCKSSGITYISTSKAAVAVVFISPVLQPRYKASQKEIGRTEMGGTSIMPHRPSLCDPQYSSSSLVWNPKELPPTLLILRCSASCPGIQETGDPQKRYGPMKWSELLLLLGKYDDSQEGHGYNDQARRIESTFPPFSARQSTEHSIAPITDTRRRFLLQLISREQNYMSSLHFGMQRFVQPLAERKDLITPNDHRTLFQNMDELLRISEDVLEQLCHDDQEPQMNFASRVYLSKTTAICAAYKKYCNGIKRADCVLVNKSRQTGSEFVAFITEPPVPRKRPDLTMFIHRPLQHFREVLKLMQLLASNCHVDTEEHKNFTTVINELQAAYREITVSSGLMEPLGEGRPLLTLQDLESRMVFTKCKPFTLAVQGRQWIFGGDLSRVEGRSVKPYWTLLFSDIIVFAKVSRDRVLFITEEPIPIANIVDSCFHMRKKTTEFRLTVDPNGRLAESPTGYCAPDLTKTPKKGSRRKSLVLRAPSLELKAVWQNLLQRQIFLVNAALGSTPLSSPLDSPDVLNTLVPLSDIGIASASIGSIKLSSMDSINLKNQQHNQQVPKQIEKLIDEKCRILNKTGTSKSSALHLANWMKGQLDKQQEQARQVVARFIPEPHLSDSEPGADNEENSSAAEQADEHITYWTRQQLEKRTQELNLAKENGLSAPKNFGGKRPSGVDVLSMSGFSQSEAASQISQSHSTTSDSQITVRSSPIVLDKLAVCRHCHKNCQKNTKNPSTTNNNNNNNDNISSSDHHEQQQQQSQTPTHMTEDHKDNANNYMTMTNSNSCPLSPTSLQKAAAASGLVCNSLKVQHSQSSPHRCCNVNGSASRASSITSISSGTVTGDNKPAAEAIAKHSKRSSNRDIGDTESDVAQLLTDDNCASETTVDEEDHGITTTTGKVGHHKGPAQEATSSTTSSATSSTTTSTTSISSTQLEATLSNTATTQDTDTDTGISGTERVSGRLNRLRILDQRDEALMLANGHCASEEYENLDRQKPEPPPRKILNVSPKKAKEKAEVNCQKSQVHEMVKMSVTITETAKIVKIEETSSTSSTPPAKSPRSPRSPKSPRTPLTPKSDRSATSSNKSKQFVACTCNCLPEDFANTTLSPEEVELKTCKILESPKQSPKMPKSPVPHKGEEDADDKEPSSKDNPHRFCRCTCSQNKRKPGEEQSTSATMEEDKEDDDLSLMLIGLAQLTPTAKLLNMTTPTAPLPTPTHTYSNYGENGFVPTIAIVPATPDSVLTKTSTNVWDNSTHISTSSSVSPATASSNLMISNIPRHQAVVENIPEDSCDESPLDEEPPYRPMMNTLRRYGTMSSLEKLPSEDRGENDYDDEDDDDDDDIDDVEADDDDDEDLMDKARADNIELDNEIRVVTKAIYSNDVAGGSGVGSTSTANAWTSRASTFVSGKMSFFEESRAFIDKYLGRWNQDQTDTTNNAITSDPEEQLDECTSGATSGEEVWGTPTSGGDNDDIHMANSENTHSSPTKSSNSLNDDDDTELMMDELLMAPPMSASSIRGLLPRRRLEPLFEEETESDEEKTQQESEELKKGETTTNGHYLEDSEAGSSSEEEEEEMGEEEGDPISMEERLQPQLQTTQAGPRPLSKPLAGLHDLPPAVLKASSCEYLLDQHTTHSIMIPITTTAISDPTSMVVTTSPSKQFKTIVNPITTGPTATACLTTTMGTSSMTTTTTMMRTATMMKATTTMTATSSETMTTTSSTMASITQTTPSPVVSLASTTTSNVNVTTKSEKDVSYVSKVGLPVAPVVGSTVEKGETKTLPRPAKFIPPPPPPRRLLLTQTNLKTSGTATKSPPKAPQPQRKSGVSADNGSSVGAKVDDMCVAKPTETNILAPQHTATTTTTMTKTKTTATPKPTDKVDVCDTKDYSADNAKVPTVFDSTKPPQEQQRLSSTIIETSLLSMVDNINSSSSRPRYTSSTTVSMMKARGPAKQEIKSRTRMASATREELEEQMLVEMEWMEREQGRDSTLIYAQREAVGLALSPRLEMRLALNQDVMGDEDSISYDPGPEQITTLVQDLSTFHRLTGRDLLNRSAMNRVQPKEAVISYSQQRNSKMDTPTVNRRPRPQLNSSVQDATIMTGTETAAPVPGSSMPFGGSARVAGVPQHLQPNRNTWSNSAYVDQSRDGNVSDANNSDDSKLSDLEILARREKIYCMSQLRSGSRAKMAKTTKTTTTKTTTASAQTTMTDSNLSNNPLMRTTSSTSMGGVSENTGNGSKSGQRQRKIGRDESALMETGKANKLINFIKRRNSEVPSSANNSQTSLNDSNSSSTPQHKQPPTSPRKDNDKPSLNRRLWKQITKRRRSNSVSELVAS